MGFFSSLFGTDDRDPEELQLELAQAHVLQAMGFPRDEALKAASERIAKAKQLLRERDLEHEPRRFGDLLLQKEKTDPVVRARLSAVRAEGVTDDDIRDWWNRPPMERLLLELGDEHVGMSIFLAAIERGATGPQAGAVVNRRHPLFGEPNPQRGEDAPIPWELRSRLTRWNETHGGTESADRLIKNSSSFNAAIRSEIRSGRL